MSSRQVSAYEVRQVVDSLPRWVGPCCRRAVHLANHGPRWLPRALRCLPLRLCALFVRVSV